MNNEIRIEDYHKGYIITLVVDGNNYELGKRATWEESLACAFYVASKIKLQVMTDKGPIEQTDDKAVKQVVDGRFVQLNE
ncbi:hypothetical protein AB4Z22_23930 [Paenibacillus sp. TAF58]